MRVSLLLCDWAEVVAGKLYAQGIGWSVARAGHPLNMAVALVIRIPYNETNIRHRLEIRLVTDDGRPVPDESDAIRGGYEFEVGRPPGMVHGDEQIVVLASTIQGIALPVGRYTWDVYRGDTKLPESITFTLVDA